MRPYLCYTIVVCKGQMDIGKDKKDDEYKRKKQENIEKNRDSVHCMLDDHCSGGSWNSFDPSQGYERGFIRS